MHTQISVQPRILKLGLQNDIFFSVDR